MSRVAAAILGTVLCASFCFSDEQSAPQTPLSVLLKVEPEYEKEIYMKPNEAAVVRVEGMIRFLRAVIVEVILPHPFHECPRCFSLSVRTRTIAPDGTAIDEEVDSAVLFDTPKTTFYIVLLENPDLAPVIDGPTFGHSLAS